MAYDLTNDVHANLLPLATAATKTCIPRPPQPASATTNPPIMSYQPTESELLRLGFRSGEQYQPFPTRSHHISLPNGHYLSLVPRPGMQTAIESTASGNIIARHQIDSYYDLSESVAGRGKRHPITG
jgi:hypothetical protein